MKTVISAAISLSRKYEIKTMKNSAEFDLKMLVEHMLLVGVNEMYHMTML